MKMRKKYLIGGVIILIVVGIFIGTFIFEKQEIKCGDNTCSLTEDCNNCIKDCGCGYDEFCNSVGVCRGVEVCGDEVCSEQEEISGDCCWDCGCSEDNICNKITQKCQEKILISNDEIKNIVQDYLTENSLTGIIKKITNSYHGQQVIKVVSIDCKAPVEEYPCEVILFINDEREIIDEMRTA